MPLGSARVLALRLRDRSWLPVLQRRYGAFMGSPQDAGSTISPGSWNVELDAARSPEDPETLRKLAAAPVRARETATGLRLLHPGFRIDVDRLERRARVLGVRHRLPLDALLRHLLAELPASLVLHAALLTDGADGWVAAGASGRGKSTLASLLPDRARCDELTLVERTEDGWDVRSTPFWNGRPFAGRLRAIHLLEHSRETRALRLAPGRALQELASQVMWPHWSPQRQERSFHLLCTLVGEVPVFRLPFRPEAAAWDVLRAAS